MDLSVLADLVVAIAGPLVSAILLRIANTLRRLDHDLTRLQAQHEAEALHTQQQLRRHQDALDRFLHASPPTN